MLFFLDFLIVTAQLNLNMIGRNPPHPAGTFKTPRKLIFGMKPYFDPTRKTQKTKTKWKTNSKTKMADNLKKKWKTNKSTKINLIGCDTIVNSPSSVHLPQCIFVSLLPCHHFLVILNPHIFFLFICLFVIILSGLVF
jgi:hypothetical protein